MTKRIGRFRVRDAGKTTRILDNAEHRFMESLHGDEERVEDEQGTGYSHQVQRVAQQSCVAFTQTRQRTR